MTREEVYKVIDAEREYQDRESRSTKRPDMVELLRVGETLTAIDYNLAQAKEAWYKGSHPHPETMDYLRKVAALIVKAGEEFGMPYRIGTTPLTIDERSEIAVEMGIMTKFAGHGDGNRAIYIIKEGYKRPEVKNLHTAQILNFYGVPKYK